MHFSIMNTPRRLSTDTQKHYRKAKKTSIGWNYVYYIYITNITYRNISSWLSSFSFFESSD